MYAKKAIYQTVTATNLTHEQKLAALAKQAENCLDNFALSERARELFADGSINDLFEGGSPYRPRYILPDYERFIERGSEFLKLAPPRNFDELLFALMILYRHVPSITNFPVYLGNLDTMMEPFIGGLSDEEAAGKLRLFLTYLDRTITDSFCHANLGPQATRSGRLILETEKTLNNAVPNFTVKYDPALTPDDFMKEAIACSLKCSNPAICNHRTATEPFGDRYGIASCYNILPVQGGAYTLTRITLTRLAGQAKSVEQFMETLLPETLQIIGDYMAQRIRFIVEKSGFFESSFLVREGLVSRDRFLGMFGVTGLAEAVDTLLAEKNLRYGRDKKADDLGAAIMERIEAIVGTLEAPYSPLTGGRYLLHAQVGLDTDVGVTSGVRIPVGEEPENFLDHLRHSARYHRFFPTGVGDIFPIAAQTEQNPDALLDVVKGAFSEGVHYLSFYAADTDLVRITGYLVKRSEMEKFDRQEAVLHDTVLLGAPAYKVNRLRERKVRMV